MSILARRKFLLAAAANESDKDPYIANTEVLIHTDGFDQQGNDSYVDSANDHIFSTLNGPIQGSFSPFSVKGWSVLFDGHTNQNPPNQSPGYFQIGSASSDLNFGTGDWQIEYWAYRWNPNKTATVIDFRPNLTDGSYWSCGIVGSWVQSQSWLSDPAGEPPVNTWAHVAWSRHNGTLRLFVNGSLVNSRSDTVNYGVGSSRPIIGGHGQATYWNAGNYILSNFRILKGRVTYLDDFDVPTEPLEVIDGTVFLGLQDNDYTYDKSPSNHTITVVQNSSRLHPKIQVQSPYKKDKKYQIQNYFSSEFNGTNSFLSMPSTGSVQWSLSGSNSDFTTSNLQNKFEWGPGTKQSHTTTEPLTTYFRFTNSGFERGGWIRTKRTQKFNRNFSISWTMWDNGSNSPEGWTIGFIANNTDVGRSHTMDPKVNVSPYPISPDLKLYLRIVNWFGSSPPYDTATIYDRATTPGTGTVVDQATNGAFGGQKYWWWDYDHSTGTHNIYFSSSSSKPASPLLTGTFEMPSTEFYLYLGAGNGGATSEWRLLDYSLSITDPVSTSFALGSNSFTLESWIYLTDTPTAYQGSYHAIIAARDESNTQRSWIWRLTGNSTTWTGLEFIGFGDNTNYQSVTATHTFNLNSWHHIAVVKFSTFVRFYVDGEDIGGTTNFTYTISSVDSILTIGGNASYWSNLGYGFYFKGYLSNLRILNGTNLYSSTFIPPTLPFNPIQTTELLTLQDNYFVDHSPRGHVITNNNNVEPKAISPFDTSKNNLTNFSMYVDGTSTTQGVAINSTGGSIYNGTWFDAVAGTASSSDQKWTIEISHLLDEFSTAGGLTSTNGVIPILSANSWYGDNVALTFYLYLIYDHNSNGKWAYFIRFKTSGGATPEFFVGDFIGLNKWHNMAVSFGSSNTSADSKIRTFMNGKLQTTSTYAALNNLNQHTSNRIHIGRWMSITTGNNPPSTTTYGKGYYHGFRATRDILYEADYNPSFPTDPGSSCRAYQLISSEFEPSTNKYNSTPIGNPNMENVSPWEASSALIEKYKMQGYASSQYMNSFVQGQGGESVPSNNTLYYPFLPPSFSSVDYTLEGYIWIDNFDRPTNSYDLPSMVTYASKSSGNYQWGFGPSPATKKAMFAYAENYTQSISGTQIKLYHSEILETKRWYHLALVVRKNGDIYIYVNGKGEKVGTKTTINNTVGYTVNIGKATNFMYMKNSYISNVRITRLRALYTSDFTPPTEPLENIPGTNLLLANRSDTEPYTYTRYNGGTTTVTPGDSSFSKTSFNPFKQKINSLIQPQGYSPSAYFDSTSDRVNVASNSDFALTQVQWVVEAFIYITSYTDNNYIIDARSSSVTNGWHFFIWGNSAAPSNIGKLCFTGTSATYQWTSTNQVPLNQWVHVVAARSSNANFRLFINGVREVNVTYGNSGQGVTNYQDGLTIGNRYSNTYKFYGYISNVRIYTDALVGDKGSYIDIPTDPLSGANNTKLLTLRDNDLYADSSSSSHSITNNGSTISTWGPFNTTQPIFDNSAGSVYFYGSGDTIYTDHSTDFDINADDFTIEGWFYVRDLSTDSVIAMNGGTSYSWTSSGGISWILYRTSSNTVDFHYWDGSTSRHALSGGTIKAYNWYHVAVCGKNSTQTLYLNGVQIDQNTSTVMYKPSNITYLSVGSGRMHNYTSSDMKGSISGLRIVKGTCLYSGNFTVPESPPNNVSNTKLLLNFNNAGVVDSLGKHNFMLKEKLSTAANQPATTAIISTDQSKFGETSVDAQESSIRIETNNSWEWQYDGDDDFTWEKWMYIQNLSAKRNIFQIGGEPPSYNTGRWNLGIETNGRLSLNRSYVGTTYFGSTGDFTTGNWFHFAWSKDGNTHRFFKDGVLKGTYTSSNTVGNTYDIYNSQYEARSALCFDDTYNEEIRITNGIARYTSNFTPPSRRFPNR